MHREREAEAAAAHGSGGGAGSTPERITSKGRAALLGIKSLLLPRPAGESLDPSAILARALLDPVSRPALAKPGNELVGFLRGVALCADLQEGELKRLARVVHERTYADGEYITQQGTPGAALFLLRSGVVEIVRRNRKREEVPLAMLEPPALFEELGAMGEAVRWISTRARGPVSLVALGRSDLDALSRDFPSLANKILRHLVQIAAARIELLLETQYFNAQDEELES